MRISGTDLQQLYKHELGALRSSEVRDCFFKVIPNSQSFSGGSDPWPAPGEMRVRMGCKIRTGSGQRTGIKAIWLIRLHFVLTAALYLCCIHCLHHLDIIPSSGLPFLCLLMFKRICQLGHTDFIRCLRKTTTNQLIQLFEQFSLSLPKTHEWTLHWV